MNKFVIWSCIALINGGFVAAGCAEDSSNKSRYSAFGNTEVQGQDDGAVRAIQVWMVLRTYGGSLPKYIERYGAGAEPAARNQTKLVNRLASIGKETAYLATLLPSIQKQVPELAKPMEIYLSAFTSEFGVDFAARLQKAEPEELDEIAKKLHVLTSDKP
jgi:hypothetical protein